MRNIFVLPTSQASRLVKSKFSDTLLLADMASKRAEWKRFNIYITNEEEIKKGDYFYSPFQLEERILKYNKFVVPFPKDKKIILTTDTQLIADGVQSIDDTFLKWFIKNPSCEEVEFEKVVVYDDNNYGDGEIFHSNKKFEYEIIIPQEEPKHELSVRLNNSLKQFKLTLEEAINTEPNILKKIGFSNKSIIELQNLKEEAKQEHNKYLSCCRSKEECHCKEEPKTGSMSECIKMIIDNQLNELEELKQETLEVCVEYFRKSHKQEKLMGTLVVITMVVASIAVFPLTKIVIGYILFCFLIYFKFLYDIKRKWNNAISEFRKKADDLS
jgi:hypothetical protein